MMREREITADETQRQATSANTGCIHDAKSKNGSAVGTSSRGPDSATWRAQERAFSSLSSGPRFKTPLHLDKIGLFKRTQARNLGGVRHSEQGQISSRL